MEFYLAAAVCIVFVFVFVFVLSFLLAILIHLLGPELFSSEPYIVKIGKKFYIKRKFLWLFPEYMSSYTHNWWNGRGDVITNCGFNELNIAKERLSVFTTWNEVEVNE